MGPGPDVEAPIKIHSRLCVISQLLNESSEKTHTVLPCDHRWICRLELVEHGLDQKSGCSSNLKSNRLIVAEPTGFEPATSDVTGRRSNQLNYDSADKPYFKFQI
jgi:hypothetical protein